MNLIDFLQAGGYRLKQATLRKMQESYFEILKAFIQHLDIPPVGNFIISGCNVAGANIASGMMYIDGELCSFATVAGTSESLIKKDVALTDLVFKSGSIKPVFRATKAIINPGGVALSSFTRIQIVKPLIWDNIAEKPPGIVLDPNFGIPLTQTLIERISALEARPMANVPIGFVGIWGLPAEGIPAGWVAHEPLAGRFPIGKDTGDPDFDSTVGAGAVGGSKTVTLGVNNLPEHSHPGGSYNEGTGGNLFTSIGLNSGSDIVKERTGVEGSGDSFSVMNPYGVVDFIRYVGVEV